MIFTRSILIILRLIRRLISWLADRTVNWIYIGLCERIVWCWFFYFLVQLFWLLKRWNVWCWFFCNLIALINIFVWWDLRWYLCLVGKLRSNKVIVCLYIKSRIFSGLPIVRNYIRFLYFLLRINFYRIIGLRKRRISSCRRWINRSNRLVAINIWLNFIRIVWQ